MEDTKKYRIFVCMKIAYVIEDFSIKGGAERIIAEKANYLATEFHHDITIISIYHDERGMSYALAKGVKLVSLHIPFTTKSTSHLATTYHRIMTLLRVGRAFQNAIDQLTPDLIFYTMSLGALLLPWCKTKAKKVYESHSARCFTPYHQLFYPMERKADVVVCLTQGDAQEYKHAKKVVVIPNFIHRPPNTHVNYDVKRAIAVGRLEHPKGFDRLITAWAKVAQAHPAWHLDIYGEGSCHEALQQLIDQLQLSQQVTLCGRRDNILDIYPNYSLHIMPSRYEGQGIALLEAQSYGLPSVSFNFQYGASDIILDGYNGLLVEQGNIDQLAEAIIKMANSSLLRQTYGQHALSKATAYYRENIFTKWTHLIASL